MGVGRFDEVYDNKERRNYYYGQAQARCHVMKKVDNFPERGGPNIARWQVECSGPNTLLSKASSSRVAV